MCFNPGPERRVPSPNRYIADAKFCFCKNNKRIIITTSHPDLTMRAADPCPTNNAKRAKHSKILKPGCFFVFTPFYQLAYSVLCVTIRQKVETDYGANLGLLYP